jgi:hypothetical protein
MAARDPRRVIVNNVGNKVCKNCQKVHPLRTDICECGSITFAPEAALAPAPVKVKVAEAPKAEKKVEKKEEAPEVIEKVAEVVEKTGK